VQLPHLLGRLLEGGIGMYAFDATSHDLFYLHGSPPRARRPIAVHPDFNLPAVPSGTRPKVPPPEMGWARSRRNARPVRSHGPSTAGQTPSAQAIRTAGISWAAQVASQAAAWHGAVQRGRLGSHCALLGCVAGNPPQQ